MWTRPRSIPAPAVPAALLGVLAAVAVGCGGDPEPTPSDRGAQRTTASEPVIGAYELTCGDLREPGARREAVDFVADVVVAPRGQPRAETAGTIRRSLRKTCSQHRLPGVDEPADYRPVKPVRSAVQSHFDQDVIYDR